MSPSKKFKYPFILSESNIFLQDIDGDFRDIASLINGRIKTNKIDSLIGFGDDSMYNDIDIESIIKNVIHYTNEYGVKLAIGYFISDDYIDSYYDGFLKLDSIIVNIFSKLGDSVLETKVNYEVTDGYYNIDEIIRDSKLESLGI